MLSKNLVFLHYCKKEKILKKQCTICFITKIVKSSTVFKSCTNTGGVFCYKWAQSIWHLDGFIPLSEVSDLPSFIFQAAVFFAMGVQASQDGMDVEVVNLGLNTLYFLSMCRVFYKPFKRHVHILLPTMCQEVDRVIQLYFKTSTSKTYFKADSLIPWM